MRESYWITPEATELWKAAARTTPGGQARYSDPDLPDVAYRLPDSHALYRRPDSIGLRYDEFISRCPRPYHRQPAGCRCCPAYRLEVRSTSLSTAPG